jgi:CxxC-x17-CxxC domain-containing protein
MDQLQDRQITCLDCNQPFVFTAGEQEFYKKKGFREEPKRCKPCRAARNARRMNQSMDGLESSSPGQRVHDADADADDIGNRIGRESARSFDDGRRRANGNGGGGGGGYAANGNGGGGRREMFDAVCAQCGAATRVPFRPAPGRPVYCRECFSNRAGVQR